MTGTPSLQYTTVVISHDHIGLVSVSLIFFCCITARVSTRNYILTFADFLIYMLAGFISSLFEQYPLIFHVLMRLCFIDICFGDRNIQSTSRL